VVVRHEGGACGLVVDRIVGAQPIVVRPLPRRGHGLPVFSGSTILGSGHVALLVDVDALVRHASEEA
jgi:two-component system chemotaxis sensor kinase CheA